MQGAYEYARMTRCTLRTTMQKLKSLKGAASKPDCVDFSEGRIRSDKSADNNNQSSYSVAVRFNSLVGLTLAREYNS